MSLQTYSLFYYGFSITEDNQAIDFDEGGSELQATLNVGDYTLTEFVAEVKRAMDAAGAQSYTVTVNRATRIITIAAAGAFTLRVTTGSRSAVSAYSLIGFTANQTGTSLAGDSAAGSQFEPQFYLQDYISSDDYQEAVDGVVNEAASGRIGTVSFGTRSFVQMNLRYATDRNPSGHAEIKTQANALANLRAFMSSITTKAPVEFMPDIDDRDTFEKLVLERTPSNSKGMGYRLIELFNDKMPGYFDTGVLLFRVVE